MIPNPPQRPPSETIDSLARLNDALTSVRWQATITTTINLRDALCRNFPHIAPESWDERLAWGGLFLNGRLPSSLDLTVSPPSRIDYFEPKYDFRAPENVFPRLREENILFKDGDLLVCYKPAKLASMAPRERRHYHLKHYLETITGQVIHMPSRLDNATQGLVVVSTSRRMHRPLQQLFERREIQKIYRLATAVHVAWDHLDNSMSIAKDPRHPILRRATGDDGTWQARTSFQVLSRCSSPQRTIVDAVPLTGRTHQIRVHAADLNIPIIGDNFYGGAPDPDLHLASIDLKFRHPLSGQALQFSAPRSLLPAWAQL